MAAKKAAASGFRGWMSPPSMQSWKALKRLCRYLNSAARLTYVYRKQEVEAVDVYTDTDWAGCVKTRKSTSGGAVMLCQHTIKHWSSTQPSVSLSSGEAEFYGVVRGAGQGLGYQALLRVWTDSSAAIGICSWQGLGKLRHLDTHTLWVQQAVRSGRLELKKVLGDENPADLLTKHSLSRERLQKLVTLYDCHFRDGRAASAPKMRTGASDRTVIAEADGEEVAEVEEEYGDTQQSPSPRMPHKEFAGDELNRRFPSLEPQETEGLEDLVRLEDDALYGKGMEVVQEILHEMATYGRTRRRRPDPGE